MNEVCAYREPVTYVAAALIFVTALVPLFWGRYLRRLFDPHLYNETYWRASSEQHLPFYAHRRASVYLAALGNRYLASRRFPGANLRGWAPRILLPFAAFYCFAMLAGGMLGMLGAGLILACGRL